MVWFYARILRLEWSVGTPAILSGHICPLRPLRRTPVLIDLGQTTLFWIAKCCRIKYHPPAILTESSVDCCFVAIVWFVSRGRTYFSPDRSRASVDRLWNSAGYFYIWILHNITFSVWVFHGCEKQGQVRRFVDTLTVFVLGTTNSQWSEQS